MSIEKKVKYIHNLRLMTHYLTDLDIPKDTKEKLSSTLRFEIEYLERQAFLELGEKAYNETYKMKY